MTSVEKFEGYKGQETPGVPGVKTIKLKMNDEGKVGEVKFRAVQARSFEFKGFGEEFNRADHESRNYVTFKINIEAEVPTETETETKTEIETETDKTNTDL